MTDSVSVGANELIEQQLDELLKGLEQTVKALCGDEMNSSEKIGRLTLELTAFSNDPSHPAPQIKATVYYAEMVRQADMVVEGSRRSKSYFLDYNPTTKEWYRTSMGM